MILPMFSVVTTAPSCNELRGSTSSTRNKSRNTSISWVRVRFASLFGNAHVCDVAMYKSYHSFLSLTGNKYR
jgi:hypothetical protein